MTNVRISDLVAENNPAATALIEIETASGLSRKSLLSQIIQATIGTTAGTVAAGDDSRMTNDRTASGLRSATTVVSVSAATAPSSGQVLTATSSTAADWQTPGGGLTGFTAAESTASPNGTVYVDSLTANGASTNVDAAFVPKGTGAFLTTVPDGTTAGGNKRGAYAVDLSTASRYQAEQVASGDYSVLTGGFRNKASGTKSGVHCGANNTASGTHSTVSGGYVNTASGNYSAVSGGGNNTASGYYSTVSGGRINTASGNYSTVSGGGNNTASGYYSTVSGGRINTASGNYSTVSGGYVNTASGKYSAVSGGRINTASGNYSAVSGGRINTASGNYSAVSGGYQGTTRELYGACAYASGMFSVQGDAQEIKMVMRLATSTTTADQLLTADAQAESATNVMVLPTNSFGTFTCMLTAGHGDGAAVGGWRIEGNARRVAGNAIVSGTPVITTLDVDAALGTPSVSIVALTGAGAGAFGLAVTPANTTETHWVARILFVQSEFVVV